MNQHEFTFCEIFSAVADTYARIESDCHEYGVILARD